MIRINPAAWQAMLTHAETIYPKECCGVLLGSEQQVEEAVPLPNVYTGPQEDFFVIRGLNVFGDVSLHREGLDAFGAQPVDEVVGVAVAAVKMDTDTGGLHARLDPTHFRVD